ncbi:hypothetical protein YC2023_064259 [Brassica napus]
MLGDEYNTSRRTLDFQESASPPLSPSGGTLWSHVSLRLGPLPPSVSLPSTRMTLRGTEKKKIAKTPTKKRAVRSPAQGISLNRRRVAKTQSSPKRKLILEC